MQFGNLHDFLASRGMMRGVQEDDSTLVQLRNLVSALGALTQIQAAYPDAEGELHKPDIDGHVKTSLDGTAIRICNRMDDLLDDRTRWAVPDKQATVTHEESIRQRQLQAAQQHLDSMRETCRPIFVLRPEVRWDRDRSVWIAIYGQGSIVDSIVGFGTTPEEACADFDRAYKERLPNERVDRPGDSNSTQ